MKSDEETQQVESSEGDSGPYITMTLKKYMTLREYKRVLDELYEHGASDWDRYGGVMWEEYSAAMRSLYEGEE